MRYRTYSSAKGHGSVPNSNPKTDEGKTKDDPSAEDGGTVDAVLHLERGAFFGPMLTVRFDGREITTVSQRQGFDLEVETIPGEHRLTVEPPSWMVKTNKILTLGIATYEVRLDFPAAGRYLVALHWSRYSSSLKLKQIERL